MVSTDGVGDPLRRHNTGGCSAGAIEPEKSEYREGAVLAHNLEEELGEVVGVAGGDQGVEVLDAEEDEDEDRD